jgi:hypothetical protein
MAQCCVRAFVTGKVQGVWYRRATQEQALLRGVTGYAKNLPDGRVARLRPSQSLVNGYGKVHKGRRSLMSRWRHSRTNTPLTTSRPTRYVLLALGEKVSEPRFAKRGYCRQ